MMGVRAHRAAMASVPSQAGPPPGELWTVDQLAVYLGVSKQSIYAWRAAVPRRGPRATIIGTRLRYNPADVAEWVAAQRESA